MKYTIEISDKEMEHLQIALVSAKRDLGASLHSLKDAEHIERRVHLMNELENLLENLIEVEWKQGNEEV